MLFEGFTRAAMNMLCTHLSNRLKYYQKIYYSTCHSCKNGLTDGVLCCWHACPVAYLENFILLSYVFVLRREEEGQRLAWTSLNSLHALHLT